MRIDGPNKSSGTRGVSKTDGKKKVSDGGFGGLVSDTSETETAAPSGGIMQIGQLDALLSFQEAEGSDQESARKGKKRAGALLDQLDQLRMGLLAGGVPQSTLRQLSSTLTLRRDDIMDPALNEILDEIDLRVQVELAKLSQ
jgi:Class II flagellar assembly regulator